MKSILTFSGTVLYLIRNPTVQLMEDKRYADLSVCQANLLVTKRKVIKSHVKGLGPYPAEQFLLVIALSAYWF